MLPSSIRLFSHFTELVQLTKNVWKVGWSETYSVIRAKVNLWSTAQVARSHKQVSSRKGSITFKLKTCTVVTTCRYKKLKGSLMKHEAHGNAFRGLFWEAEKLVSACISPEWIIRKPNNTSPADEQPIKDACVYRPKSPKETKQTSENSLSEANFNRRLHSICLIVR